MTREQAKHKIDLLDFYLQNYVNDYGEESHTAMMMAIKALEQQTCEDAVSREAVLDIFANNADAIRPYSKTWEKIRDLPSVNPQPYPDSISRSDMLDTIGHGTTYTSEDLQGIIKTLPPVNPQPKTGHWTKMVEVYNLQQNRMLVPYGHDDAKFGNTPVYVCDCGCESNKNSRFCPDCGAKMEVQE